MAFEIAQPTLGSVESLGCISRSCSNVSASCRAYVGLAKRIQPTAKASANPTTDRSLLTSASKISAGGPKALDAFVSLGSRLLTLS